MHKAALDDFLADGSEEVCEDFYTSHESAYEDWSQVIKTLPGDEALQRRLGIATPADREYFRDSDGSSLEAVTEDLHLAPRYWPLPRSVLSTAVTSTASTSRKESEAVARPSPPPSFKPTCIADLLTPPAFRRLLATIGAGASNQFDFPPLQLLQNDFAPEARGIVWDCRGSHPIPTTWSPPELNGSSLNPEWASEADTTQKFCDRELLRMWLEGFSHEALTLELITAILPNYRGFEAFEEQHLAQILKQKENGWFDGPYQYPPFLPCRTTPLNSVSKKDTDTRRLVNDAGAPRGELSATDNSTRKRKAPPPGWEPMTSRNGHVHLESMPRPKLPMPEDISIAFAIFADLARALGLTLRCGKEDGKAAYRRMIKETEALWSHILFTSLGFFLDRRAEFGGRAEADHQQRVILTILDVVKRICAQNMPTLPEPLTQWLEWRRTHLGEAQATPFSLSAFIDDAMLITVTSTVFDTVSSVLIRELNAAGLPTEPEKHDKDGDTGPRIIGLGVLNVCDATTDFKPYKGIPPGNHKRYLSIFGQRAEAKYVTDAQLDTDLGIMAFLCRCIYPRAWCHLAPIRAMRSRFDPRMRNKEIKMISPAAVRSYLHMATLLEKAPLVPIVGRYIWHKPPRNVFASDAGRKSGGAFLYGDYFISPFTPYTTAWLHINVLEMIMVMAAVLVFSETVTRETGHTAFLLGCDNLYVCGVINSLRPGSDTLMAFLLNELNILCAELGVDLRVYHEPTKSNLADLLTGKQGGEDNFIAHTTRMGRTPNRLEVPQRVTTWIAQAIDHRAHKLQGNEKTTGMDQLGARDLAKLKPEPLAPKN